MIRLLISCSIVALSVAITTAQPRTIRVPQDQPTIQAGINAAVNGDTVLVAEGTYSVNLLLAKKIVLGSQYILDGDTSHITRTILDGGTPSNPDSASVVRIGAGTDTTTVLAGFTIRNGGGTVASDPRGAFTVGGGIVFLSGGARIKRNIITSNNLTSSTRPLIGGGIGMCWETPIGFWIIEQNRIVNNVISYTGTNPVYGAEGGGADMVSNGRFENNIVADNRVNSTTNASTGGGISCWPFAGLGGQPVLFANNLVLNNSANTGAGLIIYTAATNDYPICTLINNIIANNVASNAGAAMRVNSGQYTLVNNTITGNVCNTPNKAAMSLSSQYSPPLKVTLLNNIIWNPSSTFELTPETVAGGFIVGKYNDVRGGLSGTGNIDSDPRFMSSHPDSLGWLSSNSPCLDAGSDTATVGGVFLGAPPKDYYGHVRPIRVRPDIGAFEGGTRRIRVPQDQPTIQAGINAAVNGDTVLVAEGTYSVNLLLAKKIVLGSQYILDGDTSHITRTILDGGTPSNPDSASVVRIGAGTDTTTVLAGFTIRNGGGTVGQDPRGNFLSGGGVVFLSGGARIKRNIITGNNITSSVYHTLGGGIGMFWETPIGFWIIEQNRIVNNVISYTGTNPVYGAEGGGASLGSNGRFENNIVADNRTNSTTDARYGGGISCWVFTGLGGQPVLFANNLILNNVASAGGGLIIYAETSGSDYPICTLINNIIANNSAPSAGAAMRVISGQYTLVNNTIIGNASSAASMSLAYFRGPLAVNLLNNIIWNVPSGWEMTPAAVDNGYVAGKYNDVRGGLSGTGNIDSDPLFMSSHPDSLGWFRYTSPCANAGTDTATVGGVFLQVPPKDFYGHWRAFNNTPQDIGAFEDGTWSAVEETGEGIPTAFILEQNYPNPFNPATVVSFRLPAASQVKLAVYDLLGHEVDILVNERRAAGIHEVMFDASGLASGMYLYRLTAGNFTQTRKMILVR